MTVKGKQNHYNVKFLKGYGFSIKVKDSKIVLKNCHDPFKESEVEEWYVNNMPYEKIVISGRGYLSIDAIKSFRDPKKNSYLSMRIVKAKLDSQID